MNISGLKEVILRDALLDYNREKTGNKRCLDLKITYVMSPSESKAIEQTFSLPLWEMAIFLLDTVGCYNFEELQKKLLDDIVTCHFIFVKGEIVAFYNSNTKKVYNIKGNTTRNTLEQTYQMYQLS